MKKVLNVLWKEHVVGYVYQDEENKYIFKYDDEAVKKAKENGFDYLVGFKDLEKQYESKELFPVFTSRIPPKNRHNIKKILSDLELKEYNAVDILKKTHGKCITDDIEVR